MSDDSSKKALGAKSSTTSAVEPVQYLAWLPALLGYSAWVVAAFVIAYLVVEVVISGIKNLIPGLISEESIIFGMLLSSLLYVILFAVIVYVPRLIAKKHSSWKLLGIDRLPTWKDIGIAPLGVVAYFVLAAIALGLVTYFVSGFDVEQKQDLGFDIFPTGIGAFTAFILFVVVAPVFEELIFRGYLYGHFKRVGVPVVVNVVVVSALFGLAHGQWNVGVNVAMLSVVMCLARELTGSIWTGIFMHMIKNGLAFYLLSTGVAAVIL